MGYFDIAACAFICVFLALLIVGICLIPSIVLLFIFDNMPKWLFIALSVLLGILAVPFYIWTIINCVVPIFS